MFNTLRQLWQILSPLDKRKLLLVLLLVVSMALIEAAGVISIMPFLAVISNPDVIEKNNFFKKIYDHFSISDYRQFVLYLGVVSLFVVVFSTIFKIITQYALNRFSNLQRHYFSNRLLKVYLEQNYDFFIQRNSSDLEKNVLAETDQLVWGVIQPILLIVSYSVVILMMIAILLFFDPIMAVSTALVISSLYFLIYFVVKRKLNKIGSSFAEANAGRYQSCKEALEGIKDVIVNDAKQGYINTFRDYSRIYSRHIATRDTLGQIPLYIIETVGYGGLIILSIILIFSGKNISHILPILGLYGFSAYRMMPAAQNIYRSVTQIKFSEHVFNNIKSEFDLGVNHRNQDNKENNLNFKNSIRLENISFSYPNRQDKKVLNNFNLTVAKNTSIGIVGKSGSGKSTLMDIMLGLLKPQQGKIFIDDVELTDQNLTLWYKLIGYVPQNIYLADKTIAENIAFGSEKIEINFIELEQAAKQAQIHEFIISELPNGYSTLVGEHGVMLSGGQRQRIGIARALYKNPQILFMDEATSALDVETERTVNDAIQNLSRQKTIIIIAHRESAVSKCDSLISLSSLNGG